MALLGIAEGIGSAIGGIAQGAGEVIGKGVDLVRDALSAETPTEEFDTGYETTDIEETEREPSDIETVEVEEEGMGEPGEPAGATPFEASEITDTLFDIFEQTPTEIPQTEQEVEQPYYSNADTDTDTEIDNDIEQGTTTFEGTDYTDTPTQMPTYDVGPMNEGQSEAAVPNKGITLFNGNSPTNTISDVDWDNFVNGVQTQDEGISPQDIEEQLEIEDPTQEQVEQVNEIAHKDNEGDIELNPNVNAEQLNSLNDNNSNISNEDVEKAQETDVGNNEVDESVIKQAVSLDDKTWDNFIQQATQEQELKDNYTDETGLPYDFNKNVFGETVYNNKEDLVGQLGQYGFNEKDVDVKVGKDDQGYYYYAVPTYEKEMFDEAQLRSETTPAKDMSETELKNVLKGKRDERVAKEEAAKLKNRPTEEIEQALKSWSHPTPEEWERSYTNGTVGQLRQNEAEHRRYVKELEVRKFLSKNPAYKQFEKEIRKEIGSKSKVNAIKERLGKRYEPTDYEGRMLAVVYRELDKQPPITGSTVEVDNVYIKDENGNLTEPNSSLTEVKPNEVENVPTYYDKTTDILMSDDKTGEVYVVTNDTLGEDEQEFDQDETYLEDVDIPNWEKDGDGYTHEIDPKEAEESGLTEEEYEDSLLSEAEGVAERLGLKQGEYEVTMNEKVVGVQHGPSKVKKRKHFSLKKFIKKYLNNGEDLLEPSSKGGELETYDVIEPNKPNVGSSSVGSVSVGDVPTGSSGQGGSGSSSSAQTSSMSDVSSSKVSGSSPIETPTIKEGRSSGGGKTMSVDNEISSATKTNIGRKGTATSSAARMLKEQNESKGNRLLNKETGIKSKYRSKGSKSKQFKLSTIHHDNSMISIIDKLSEAVIRHYKGWDRNGEYYVFVGSVGSIRYRIGGSIEIKFKGQTNWASLKTISKHGENAELLEKLLEELK